MISPKKIDILLSPYEIKKVLNRKSKDIGIFPREIKKVRIKIIKKYTDWRSFTLVAFYTINKGKIIVGKANSDGKKEYAFKMNDLVFDHLSKINSKNYSVPKPYCYIKSLELFLGEYLKGRTFAHLLKENKKINPFQIKGVAEIISILQKTKSKSLILKKGICFSDIEKNVRMLKKRKKKEAKIISKTFQYFKKTIRSYERKNKNKVLVHGDLNPNNIFFEKNKVKIVDFENVHLGDRISDLANLLSHFETSLDFKIPEQERIFLKDVLLESYQRITKRFDDFEKEKLKIHKNYFDLLSTSHIMVWGNYSRGLKLFKKWKTSSKIL